MATTLLGRRNQPRGVEFILDVDGKEVTLWKYEHDDAEEQAVTQAWIVAQINNLRAARQAQQAEESAEETGLDAQAFFTWLYQNRANPRLRDLLRPAVRVYRESL